MLLRPHLNAGWRMEAVLWVEFETFLSVVQSETRLAAPKRSHLPDEDFLKWLTAMGGTPPELLANPDVLKLFLPALKADLHVVENYRWGGQRLPSDWPSFESCDQPFPSSLQPWPTRPPAPVLPSLMF